MQVDNTNRRTSNLVRKIDNDHQISQYLLVKGYKLSQPHQNDTSKIKGFIQNTIYIHGCTNFCNQNILMDTNKICSMIGFKTAFTFECKSLHTLKKNQKTFSAKFLKIVYTVTGAQTFALMTRDAHISLGFQSDTLLEMDLYDQVSERTYADAVQITQQPSGKREERPQGQAEPRHTGPR